MALAATRTANPWRFSPGDHVYICSPSHHQEIFHPQEPAIITSRVQRSRANWPHYFAVDADGHEWLVPQIHLSSSPIQA
jgi:hypothetical protein